MSFLNFRIRGRLYGGFAILLLFCAGLAAFGVSQLTAIHEQVEQLSLQSRNTIRVGEISTELQAIRRGILRYAFDQDEASFAESDNRLSRIADLLDQAVNTSKVEERKANYREAARDVAELKRRRAELAEAVKQMVAGRAELFTEGDKVTADVQKLVDGTRRTPFEHDANVLETRVLLVREASWRTLATRDAKVSTPSRPVSRRRRKKLRISRRWTFSLTSRSCWRRSRQASPNMPRRLTRPDPASSVATSSITRASRR